MDRFSDAGASHTAKSPLQNSVITFCEIKIRPIVLNTNKTALIIVFELSYLSRKSKPRNPVMRPAVQCRSPRAVSACRDGSSRDAEARREACVEAARQEARTDTEDAGEH